MSVSPPSSHSKALLVARLPSGHTPCSRTIDSWPARRLSPFQNWCEGVDIVRMSLKHDESGLIAYLQGGAPLLELARELGWRIERTDA